jgi:hypothetical protein
MADHAVPDEETRDTAFWSIPGIAEISLERATGTVTGVRPKGVPETPPTEYAAMDIDELRAVAHEYRLALRDGTLLADLIDAASSSLPRATREGR